LSNTETQKDADFSVRADPTGKSGGKMGFAFEITR
jgi:hypothetical protein